jgi:hypothetical protein
MKIITFLLLVGSCFAQPTLTLSGPSSVNAGSIVNLSLTISGASGLNVAGVQWKYNFPSGFTPQLPIVGFTISDLGFTVSCNPVDSSCLVIDPTAINTFGNGMVASIPVFVGYGVTGSQSLNISNVVGTDSSGHNLSGIGIGGNLSMNVNALTITLLTAAVSILEGQVGPQQQVFNAPPPPPVTTINYQVTGNPGTANAYYWVVAKYPSGNAVPNSVYALNIPSSLSASQYVTIRWNPPSSRGVSVSFVPSYDVLKTSTPNIPGGNCNCALVTNTTATSFQDQGGGFSSYTVSSQGVARGTITLDNLDASSPQFVFNPPVSGGGGIGGSITSGQVAVGSGVNTIGGYSGLTYDNTTDSLIVNGDPQGDSIVNVTSTVGGVAIVAASTDTDDTNSGMVFNGTGTEIDSTGSGDTFAAMLVSEVLNGSDIDNDTAVGIKVVTTNTGTGTAGTLAGIRSDIGNIGSTNNLYAFQAATPTLGTVTGVAAAFDAEDWGVGNYAFHNSGQSLAKPEGTVTQTNLGTVPLGAFIFCSDCTVVTCAGSGGGAWVFGTASGNVCPF